MQWAEEDGADWDAFLATEPTPLRRELARVGLHGLHRRWGITHGSTDRPFDVIFGDQDLHELPLPLGVPAPPEPEPDAGESVRITVRPMRDDEPWCAYQGLALRWSGAGSRASRDRYRDALGRWLAGFMAIFETRPPDAGVTGRPAVNFGTPSRFEGQPSLAE